MHMIGQILMVDYMGGDPRETLRSTTSASTSKNPRYRLPRGWVFAIPDPDMQNLIFLVYL